MEIQQLSLDEGSQPINDEKISHQVFGDQSRYYKGLVKPKWARDMDRDSSSNNGYLRNELELIRLELQDIRSRLIVTEDMLLTQCESDSKCRSSVRLE